MRYGGRPPHIFGRALPVRLRDGLLVFRDGNRRHSRKRDRCFRNQPPGHAWRAVSTSQNRRAASPRRIARECGCPDVALHNVAASALDRMDPAAPTGERAAAAMSQRKDDIWCVSGAGVPRCAAGRTGFTARSCTMLPMAVAYMRNGTGAFDRIGSIRGRVEDLASDHDTAGIEALIPKTDRLTREVFPAARRNPNSRRQREACDPA